MMKIPVNALSCLALTFLLSSCKPEEVPPPDPPKDFDMYVSDIGTMTSPAKILKYDSEGNNGTTFINANQGVQPLPDHQMP
jgi:hypothetical protein